MAGVIARQTAGSPSSPTTLPSLPGRCDPPLTEPHTHGREGRRREKGGRRHHFLHSGTDRAIVHGVEVDFVYAKVQRAQLLELKRQGVAGPYADGVHLHRRCTGLTRAAAEEVAAAPAAARRPLRLQQPLDVQKDAAGSELRRYAPQGVGQASEGGQGVGRQLVPGDTSK